MSQNSPCIIYTTKDRVYCAGAHSGARSWCPPTLLPHHITHATDFPMVSPELKTLITRAYSDVAGHLRRVRPLLEKFYHIYFTLSASHTRVHGAKVFTWRWDKNRTACLSPVGHIQCHSHVLGYHLWPHTVRKGTKDGISMKGRSPMSPGLLSGRKGFLLPCHGVPTLMPVVHVI